MTELVAAALELAGSFTRHDWARYILVQRAIRSHDIQSKDGPRLPIFILHRDDDPVQIRLGVTLLFKTEGVYGVSLGQGSLMSMLLSPCLLRDRTAASIESLFWDRQLAYQRSLPKSIVGGKRGVSPTYGDTIIIVPSECAADLAPWGYVIEAECAGGEADSLWRYEHSLKDWRIHAERFVSGTLGGIRLDPAALPCTRPTSGYLRQGYLYDLAFSASLENVLGTRGFVDAGLKSWNQHGGLLIRRLTSRQQDIVAISYLREYLRTAKADHGEGFREDLLAQAIRKQDPEMFGNYSAIDLGKSLSRLGLGVVSRHGFYDEARRVIRAVVNFSAEDHRRMEELERGL
jgi:hypothetical protein